MMGKSVLDKPEKPAKPVRKRPRKVRTEKDVISICNIARVAWSKAKRSARIVSFEWEGGKYVSTISLFRVKIDMIDGEPVACYYE